LGGIWLARESAASCQECRVAAPASLAWKIGSSGAWLTMKRRPGFTRRAVNDHFSTSVASTAAPNGCRRSIAPPANPIYLCACHAAQGRARPGTPGMTLGTGCADLCPSPRIRELPRPTYSGYEAVASLRPRLGPDEWVHVVRQRHVRGSVRCGQRETSARKTACRRPDRRRRRFRPRRVATPGYPNDPLPPFGSPKPEPHREPSPEGRFSARRPRHRASDMTLLNVPLITYIGS